MKYGLASQTETLNSESQDLIQIQAKELRVGSLFQLIKLS